VLALLSLFVVGTCVATRSKPIVIWPDFEAGRWVDLWIGEGELIVERWVDRPFQRVAEDRWYFGFRSIDLGIGYSGTYITPGYVRIHGASYQLRAPLWFLAALAGAYPVIVAIRYVRSRRRRPPEACKRCGYNLTGNVSGICPECGTPIGNGQSA